MPKNIVIFSDGTGQAGGINFDEARTNIYKLYRAYRVGSDESTYRHCVSTARSVAIFGFLACDNARQAIVRAERLNAELIKNVDKLFAPFPLGE
jgi:hypothetical protein